MVQCHLNSKEYTITSAQIQSIVTLVLFDKKGTNSYAAYMMKRAAIKNYSLFAK